MIVDDEMINRWLAIGKEKGFSGCVIYRHPRTEIITVIGIEEEHPELCTTTTSL